MKTWQFNQIMSALFLIMAQTDESAFWKAIDSVIVAAFAVAAAVGYFKQR